MENEQWKPVIGLENEYMISNYGRVLSLNNNILLKGSNNKNGYIKYKLKGKWVYAHRLVAIHFLPNPDNLPIVNHKNENKTNNYFKNLEWCTVKYNSEYNDLNIKRAMKIGKNIECDGKEYYSIKECAKEYNVNRKTMNSWLSGKRTMPEKFKKLGLKYI